MLLLVLTLWACGDPADPEPIPDASFAPPDALGPSRVGATSGFIGGVPELPVSTWYPTDETVGSTSRFDGIELGTALADVVPSCASPVVSPSAIAGLDRVGHFSFADLCIFPDDGCGPDFLPKEVATAQIATLATAFLQQQLGAPDVGAYLPPDAPGLQWQSR